MVRSDETMLREHADWQHDNELRNNVDNNEFEQRLRKPEGESNNSSEHMVRWVDFDANNEISEDMLTVLDNDIHITAYDLVAINNHNAELRDHRCHR